MKFHGALRDEERAGDFLIAHTLRHETQHIRFTIAELIVTDPFRQLRPDIRRD
jgi:hypothetical protein